MQRQYVYVLATAWLLILTLTSCGGRRERRSEATADKPAKTRAEPAPPSAPTVGQVHLFLETSASMGGYLRGNTDFKNVVAELATKAQSLHPVTVWTIAGTPTKFAGDVEQFRNGLATTPLASGKSSELHKIFRQVAAKAKGNDVAILVSDCILSFPDAEVRRNPEINRQNAQSVLKNAIYSEFEQLNRQGISARVYAYTSPFFGTYYDYRNGKHKLDGQARPYYVWVIGRQPLVASFTQQLQERLNAQPVKQQTFGGGGAVQQHNLLFSVNKKGRWRAERGGVADLTARPQNPAEFAVAVDLSALPTYAQAESYLRSNLNVVAPDATVKLVNVQKKAALPNVASLKPAEQKLLTNATHVLTFRVEGLLSGKTNVVATLPARADTWYADWSTMDDTKPELRKGKTFALVHLMDGVKEAYQNKAGNFVQLTIPMNE